MPLPANWSPALDSLTIEALRSAESAVGLREKEGALVFPPVQLRYRALELVNPAQVRVVILGQDPYHRAGQAMGLAFAVQSGAPLPPSLRNIFKELSADLRVRIPASGELTPWAMQGVLLLNTALTVEEGAPGSHSGLGWEQVTDRIILHASEIAQRAVFML